MGVCACFGMDCDQIAACICKWLKIWIARRNHQMRIEESLGARTNCFHHLRTERDVRNEMAIHNIDMNPVGTRFKHGIDFLAQARKVCGKDGWGDCDRTHSCLPGRMFVTS
ncbi:hypothetical protein D3C80_722160 [compost metagenome]